MDKNGVLCAIMSHAAVKQEQGKVPDSTSEQQTVSHNAELPVGEILRRTRIHYGQSLTDVEKALRIPMKQLEAIEAGHGEDLPARVYAIGFVRSYSQYLGLDTEHVVALFKAQADHIAPAPDLNFPVSAQQSSLPSWRIIVISAALLFIVPITIWLISGKNSENNTDVPPVSEELKAQASIDVVNTVPTQDDMSASVTTTPQTSASDKNKAQDTSISTNTQQEAAPASPPKRKGIVLSILENSWVEIKGANGKRLVSRVLKAGDQYFVPERPGLTMSIGNAAGVEISVDGEALPLLGESGSVIRNIPLNAKKLKTLEN